MREKRWMSVRKQIGRGSPGRLPARDLADHAAALVEASGRLFREHGFAGVSIDMIARSARVSPKTIYARYGGKLGVFQAVVGALVETRLGEWRVLPPSDDVAETLRQAARGFLDVVLAPEFVALERMMIAEAPRLPDLARAFYDAGPRLGLAALRAFFQRQADAGRLAIRDPKRAAEAFIGLVGGEWRRRALLLDDRPTDAEREAWIADAVAIFIRAHAGEG